MPQSSSQVEANEQVPDEIDAALDAALEKSGVDVERKAIQDAAAAEERRAAELIAQVREAQAEPTPAPKQDESLVSVMAGGREHLLQRMRAHMAEAQAKKEAYRPPPLTERQQAAIAEEQEAGRKARERHERELASRPPPPAKEKWDGTNTPVFRPGSAVPDPARPVTPFAAGNRQYGADV